MRIRALRLERGWSQEQLAERSGLSVRTVQRIENGHAPGRSSSAALAQAFGVDVCDLDDPVDPGAVTSPSPMSFQAATRACLTGYAEFDGRARRAEYWWFVLFVVLVAALGTLVHEVVGAAVLLVLALPLLAAGTRRLHDAGRSGWWQLLSIVPFGGVVPLILLMQPSTPTADPAAPTTVDGSPPARPVISP